MAATPKPKYMMLGKSRFVHVVRTSAWDRKHSECQHVRKMVVADKVNYKDKGMSAEAALALDSCTHCATHETIQANLTPEQKREQAKAKRDETLDKIAAESKPKKKGKGKATKEAKPKPRKSKAGTSVGGTQEKADALAAFAKEHGWATSVDDANPGLVVTAVRGAETISCFFVDGKYDTSRHATLEVGGWTGKLRGVHGCRKQMAGEGRDRPHPSPGKGRSGPRKKAEDEDIPEDESPEDAARRLPFSLDDDTLAILDKIKGNIIKWRNGQANLIEEAWLPGKIKGKKRDLLAIIEHPKTGRRMLNFLTVSSVSEHGEQYGPERTVYLDKIIRVVES